VDSASPDAGTAPRDAVFSELKREIMIRAERYKYVVDEHGQGGTERRAHPVA
jgi:hypothetical protein